MSNKLKFVLNRDGVRDLLRSSQMLDACLEHANATMHSLSDGYEVSTYVGQNRVNVSVGTATYEAMRDNLENNTLLKALK